jgi:hypothetical protein
MAVTPAGLRSNTESEKTNSNAKSSARMIRLIPSKNWRKKVPNAYHAKHSIDGIWPWSKKVSTSSWTTLLRFPNVSATPAIAPASFGAVQLSPTYLLQKAHHRAPSSAARRRRRPMARADRRGIGNSGEGQAGQQEATRDGKYIHVKYQNGVPRFTSRFRFARLMFSPRRSFNGAAGHGVDRAVTGLTTICTGDADNG